MLEMVKINVHIRRVVTANDATLPLPASDEKKSFNPPQAHPVIPWTIFPNIHDVIILLLTRLPLLDPWRDGV